jgi:nitroreductase
MAFLDLVRQRRSVRRFRPDPVPRTLLADLVEAVRLAPSACNSQPWRLILVDDPARRAQVAAATTDALTRLNRFVADAPLLAVFALRQPRTAARIGRLLTGRDYPLIDLGAAAEHFCLAAAEIGLGTCLLGWFHERRIRRLLGVPRGIRIGLVVAVGFPAEAPPTAATRLPADAMHAWNAWQDGL